MEQTLQICQDVIENERVLTIGVVNGAKVVKMRHDPFLREAVLNSDLVVADGQSVVWASRLLGQPVPERVTGIDLFEGLLELAHQHELSVYFLGATQEILDEVVRRTKVRYPRLRLVGSRNGYFKDDEAEQVANEIRLTRPQMIFIGITSPKKEIFLGEYGDRLGANVCHGVGGSFDVTAGKAKRAPPSWQRCGLEWLYRTLQEPRRLWKRYLVTNTIFVAMVLRELFQGRSGG
jgi:N-acetylglucosaminyldiphosphoundecaprenol N-acetyl-beta-D-mannosaminyltransferase